MEAGQGKAVQEVVATGRFDWLLPTHATYRSRPELKGADPTLYTIVAQRRMQWDSLVWQVPVLSLTAQAFLLTIALSSGNGQFARVISAGLAMCAAVFSMNIMASHRQAEIMDAHWLQAYEEANDLPALHGQPWAAGRRDIRVARGIDQFRSFRVWMFGFSLFAVAALASLVIALVAPHVLR
jgi:hypothetical protein